MRGGATLPNPLFEWEMDVQIQCDMCIELPLMCVEGSPRLKWGRIQSLGYLLL